MAEVKIVVIDGVRYREEDVPKKQSAASEDQPETAPEVQHKMRKPASRARSKSK